jgi:hypothetical protein
MLDHVEPELGEPTKQAQAEDPANLVLDQGKPRYIPPIFLGLSFNHYFCFKIDCALSW